MFKLIVSWLAVNYFNAQYFDNIRLYKSVVRPVLRIACKVPILCKCLKSLFSYFKASIYFLCPIILPQKLRSCKGGLGHRTQNTVYMTTAYTELYLAICPRHSVDGVRRCFVRQLTLGEHWPCEWNEITVRFDAIHCADNI